MTVRTLFFTPSHRYPYRTSIAGLSLPPVHFIIFPTRHYLHPTELSSTGHSHKNTHHSHLPLTQKKEVGTDTGTDFNVIKATSA